MKKYISYALRVLTAISLLAMPLACVALFGLTEDVAFLIPLSLSFAAVISVTELDKKGGSPLLHWFCRPLGC